MLITKIKGSARKPHRSHIYIDGEYCCSLNNRTLVKIGLKEGDDISEETRDGLAVLDLQEKATAKAIQALSRRSHTQKELYQKLIRTFPKEIVNATMQRVRAEGLLDDERFVKDFMETVALRNYSKQKVIATLSSKGVSQDLISRYTDSFSTEDELEAAKNLLEKKLRHLNDAGAHRDKLLAYLGRRGFGYDIARKAVEMALDAE